MALPLQTWHTFMLMRRRENRALSQSVCIYSIWGSTHPLSPILPKARWKLWAVLPKARCSGGAFGHRDALLVVVSPLTCDSCVKSVGGVSKWCYHSLFPRLRPVAYGRVCSLICKTVSTNIDFSQKRERISWSSSQSNPLSARRVCHCLDFTPHCLQGQGFMGPVEAKVFSFQRNKINTTPGTHSQSSASINNHPVSHIKLFQSTKWFNNIRPILQLKHFYGNI